MLFNQPQPRPPIIAIVGLEVAMIWVVLFGLVSIIVPGKQLVITVNSNMNYIHSITSMQTEIALAICV